MKLTTEQAAYLAGAIDGEGCITWSGLSHLRVQIANTNRSWLERFQEWIGGTIQEHRGRFNKRPSFSLSLTLQQSTETLSAVQPFLFLKRRQAEVFFQLLEIRARYQPTIRRGHRADPNYHKEVLALRGILSKLNQRGVVSQPYPGVPPSNRICFVEQCGRKHYGNGYCKQHHKKYIERGGPKWYDKVCAHCGKPFVAQRADATYCSKPCTALAYYAIHKATIINRSAQRRAQKRDFVKSQTP